MFRAYVLIIGRSKLHYTASGIITSFTISLFHVSTCFEHMCSKHVEAWSKLIVKQKFGASSWLITEINILRRTVSKTSKHTHTCWNYIHMCVYIYIHTHTHIHVGATWEVCSQLQAPVVLPQTKEPSAQWLDYGVGDLANQSANKIRKRIFRCHCGYQYSKGYDKAGF